MKTVHGKFGSYARLLKYSSTAEGKKIASFEVQFPRMVLAELNTHAMLAKNSASSRAIPFTKMVEQLVGRPTRFGQANKGMQDRGEDFAANVVLRYGEDGLPDWASNFDLGGPEEAWDIAKQDAIAMSRAFYEAGYHKQVYNRLTEPFQMIKTVITATEFANFFWLRDHGAADPTIAELAKLMRECLNGSHPVILNPGEWHLPYVETEFNEEGDIEYFILTGDGDKAYISLEEAIKVSAARSAAVSFRNVDYGVEKSNEVHERLVGDERKHASAMEHQATPMQAASIKLDNDGNGYDAVNLPTSPDTWEAGISHLDRDRELWSGKFCGWIQYRKLVPGENVKGFDL